MSNPLDQNYSFDAVPPTELLAKIVRDNSVYLRTAGGSWVDIGAPSFVTSNWTNGGSIGMAPSGKIFLLWQDGGTSQGCRLFEHTGGTNWSQISGAIRCAYWAKFYPISDDEIWFAGNNSNGVHAVHWSRSGGITEESFPGYSGTGIGIAACIVMPDGSVLISSKDVDGATALQVWRRPPAGPPWSQRLSSSVGAGTVGAAIWSPDGTNVWTGKDNGQYHRSTDGGLSWPAHTTTPESPNASLLGIGGDTDDDMVLVWSDGLISHWDGMSWTEAIYGTAHEQVIRIGGIWYVDDRQNRSLIWYSSDGQTWNNEAIPGASGGGHGNMGPTIAGVLAGPAGGELLRPDPEQRQPGTKTVYRDSFTDFSTTVTKEPYGTADAGGGSLALHLDASESGDRFFNDTYEVPRAVFELGNYDADIIEIESACSAFTGSNTQRIYGMALMDSDQPKHSYYQFLYREDIDRVDVERGLQGAGHVNLAAVGFGTFNGQHRMRVILNRVENTIYFWMSSNNGASWSLIHSRTADFHISTVALYIRQFSSNPSVDVTFDYLEIRAGSTTPRQASPAPGTVSSTEDAFDFPASTEGEQHDHVGYGIGGALYTPRPATTEESNAFPPRAKENVEDHGGFGIGGFLQDERSALRDGVLHQVDPPADYTDFKQDVDGNDFLGGQSLSQVIKIDTTPAPFGDPVGNGHYGAAADGNFYANGVLCGPGDFGTLAGGFRNTAWRRSLDEPQALWHDAGLQPTLIADGTLRFDSGGVVAAWSNHASSVSSNNRWVLTGDFDIEVEYENWVRNSGNDMWFSLTVGQRWADPQGGSFDIFRIARYDAGGSGQYYKSALNNGSTIGLATVATSDTAGKLRITRTGTTLRAYYWAGGWLQLGTDETGAVVGSGDLFVHLLLQHNATDGRVDAKNFLINMGNTSSQAGWYRESSGAHRGTKPDMPDSLGVVCTVDSVDLVDLATNKLWMRFVGGVGNVVIKTNCRPRRVAWNDGLLLLAQGSGEFDSQEGAGTLIDFTQDRVRIYRETGSIPGAFYGTERELASGHISQRNAAASYGGSDVLWEIPDYRVHDADIYRTGGYEYHAMATVDGVGMGKWQRWYEQDTPIVGTSKSTETTTIRAVVLDPVTGELFYMDDTSLYSCPRATWEGVMPTTQVFSAATTKTLPGTRTADEQKHMVRFGANIMVPAQEGVYDAPWPAGSFTLFYGTPGSGATHEILPPNTGVRAIAHAVEGVTNLLICGLESDHAEVAVINLDSNTLYGIVPRSTIGKAPVSVAG